MDNKVYLFINIFKFYFVYINILPVCGLPVHLMCAEPTAGYWISWKWSYRCSCGCWKLNPSLLCRNSKPSLTAESSSLQTHMAKLNKVHKYIFKILKSPMISFHYNKISYKSDRVYGIGTQSTGQLKEATLFTSHWQRRSQFDGHVSIQVWEIS